MEKRLAGHIFRGGTAAMLRAAKYSKRKHGNKTRKFTDEPYYRHPFRVARTIWEMTESDEMTIAAYLHDVVEDTTATIDDVKEKFGRTVAGLVDELTVDKDDEILEGKVDYHIRRMGEMSDNALLIRLADRLDNVSGLTDTPDAFWKRYTGETLRIINGFSRHLDVDHIKLIGMLSDRIKSEIRRLNLEKNYVHR